MKYMIVFLTFFVTYECIAQTSLLPVECVTMRELTAVLAEYDEKPFAIAGTQRATQGNVAENHVLFFVNPKTRTWTIAEKVSDNKYCVLSGGTNFSLVSEKGNGI